MRLFVLALLLAPLAPSAAAECTEHGCADAWSEDAGSCGAAGSERNVAEANTSTVSHRRVPAAWLNATRVHVETFCVRSDRAEYREVRVIVRTDPRVDDNETHVLWSYDGSHCRLDMQREAPGRPPEFMALGCPANTRPPEVPSLFSG